MIPASTTQPFPLHVTGYATIAQPWNQFRHISHDDQVSQEYFYPVDTVKGGELNDSQPNTDATNAISTHNWQWPDRAIIFISDPHADADAFRASLLASGGVKESKKGKLELTSSGKKATFVIGGDCLDKGPSNLALLRTLKQFINTGAKTKLLAGNHDLRLLTGLAAISRKRHVSSEHMFVRMGSKVIPLFKEVFEQYIFHKKNWQKSVPDESTCKALLYPRDSWFDNFPSYARKTLSDKAIAKEVQRLETKVANFEAYCQQHGMSLQMVYAAAKQCQKLFFSKSGEFSWFFRNMQLAHKKGSFLFVHAGLDDSISEQIRQKGIKKLNRTFKKTLREDLFEFYFSSLATPFRTKYRQSDPLFSGKGAKAVKARGIYCVVHGHVSHCDGQHISLQKGLLHVEGDITLDRNSRRKEGLQGIGFGATIIHPRRMIIGISSDHPVAKVLSPDNGMAVGRFN